MAAKQTGQTARKAPISAHPAFPAIVALWFAALLGVGSLVLPATVFENLIAATGLPSAIPAAQPPLGFGARILIALVGAGLGTVAGLFIARKVADAQGARTAKRPISAREELGAESFDEPVEEPRSSHIRARLRALTMTDASDDPLENRPFENGSFKNGSVEPAPAPIEEPADAEEEAAPPARDPLDLTAFAAVETDDEGEEETDASRPFDALQVFTAPDPVPAEPSRAVADETPLHERSIAELVERFALSLQRAAERAEAETAVEETPTRYVPDLGVEASEAPRFEASEPISATRAADIPAALRPVWVGEEIDAETDDGEDHLSLSLSLASFDGGDEEDGEPAQEGGYSSLLNVRPSEARRESVRIDEEPAAAFPCEAHAGRPFDAPTGAESAPDRAQAERALREALHKLQRMSGAA